MTARISLLVLVLAGCSGDDGGVSIDAAPSIDAPAAATVTAVTCPASPAGTVMTTDATFSYMPSAVTITQGQVVKFMMSLNHDVAPNLSGSDPGLVVGFNKTVCLMFSAKGTFGFHCSPHSFAGTITVN